MLPLEASPFVATVLSCAAVVSAVIFGEVSESVMRRETEMRSEEEEGYLRINAEG